MDLVLIGARLVLVAVFLLAAITKFLDRAGSREAVAAFGVPQSFAGPVSVALPVAELLVAVALLPARTAWMAAVGAVMLLAFFIAGISYNLARGETPDCHCFGQLYSEPIGIKTIVRNVVLALVAVFVLVAGYGGPGPDALSWLGDTSGIERLALAVAVVAVIAAGAQWWILLHPPHWLAERLPMLGATSMVESPVLRRDMTPVGNDTDRQEGVPVGAAAPRFRLPGLHGEVMTLDSLRSGGRAVVLVFVSPSCGPCNALMPDLSRWQIEYAAALRFVLVSSGSVEDNRAKVDEHGVVEVLLQKSFEVGAAYGAGGTPSAVIVHPNGTIASPVAGGADHIRALVDQYIELLAAEVGVELEDEGELERALKAAANPLELGSPAPELEFEGMAGERVPLRDFRGRDTMLLFWGIDCRFCRELEPELRAWEESPPPGAPQLVIVIDAPASVRESIGLRSPVLIDIGGDAGRVLYSAGTPTAVLIDAAGTIASQPLVGVDAVRLALGITPPAAPQQLVPLLDRAPARPAAAPSLTVGDPAPGAPLLGLRGQTVRMSELRGQETLVVFWDAIAPECRAIEAELLQCELGTGEGATPMVVVVPGARAANQVVNFGSDLLIDLDGSARDALGVVGIPAAVLLDAQARVAVPPVVGGEGVLELVRDTVQHGRAALA